MKKLFVVLFAAVSILFMSDECKADSRTAHLSRFQKYDQSSKMEGGIFTCKLTDTSGHIFGCAADAQTRNWIVGCGGWLNKKGEKKIWSSQYNYHSEDGAYAYIESQALAGWLNFNDTGDVKVWDQ